MNAEFKRLIVHELLNNQAGSSEFEYSYIKREIEKEKERDREIKREIERNIGKERERGIK